VEWTEDGGRAGARSRARANGHGAQRRWRARRRHPARPFERYLRHRAVTKLRLKSEIEDLVSDLAALHAGHATETLDGLHARYRDLVLRVIALLEQGDALLAHDLTVSTDHNLGHARRPRAVHLAGEELNSRPPSEGRARGVAHALPTKTRAPGLHATPRPARHRRPCPAQARWSHGKRNGNWLSREGRQAESDPTTLAPNVPHS